MTRATYPLWVRLLCTFITVVWLWPIMLFAGVAPSFGTVPVGWVTLPSALLLGFAALTWVSFTRYEYDGQRLSRIRAFRPPKTYDVQGITGWRSVISGADTWTEFYFGEGFSTRVPATGRRLRSLCQSLVDSRYPDLRRAGQELLRLHTTTLENRGKSYEINVDTLKVTSRGVTATYSWHSLLKGELRRDGGNTRIVLHFPERTIRLGSYSFRKDLGLYFALIESLGIGGSSDMESTRQEARRVKNDA